MEEDLKLYFITDHEYNLVSMEDQVKKAIRGGATIIQYRNKDFSAEDLPDVEKIASICRLNRIPFIINDNILLAKAVDADGIHLGQDDIPLEKARKMMGPDKIIGISISTPDEFKKTDISYCDYIGSGPVFATSTKKDAKKPIGVDGLKKIVTLAEKTPVVGIGGIKIDDAKKVMTSGTAGIAVISAISRAENIETAAHSFAESLGLPQKNLHTNLYTKWNDEFAVIDRIKTLSSFKGENFIVGAGDDAALLRNIERPVISTDTQMENVHFKLRWQSMYEIGFKAVSVALSDLAASFARPLAIFINLGIPDYVSEKDMEDLYMGMEENLNIHKCKIGGGNISRGERLSIDIFAVGEGSKIFPMRSKVRKGEILCSTGHLGLAKAGLEIFQKGIKGFDFLRESFKRPTPDFQSAEILKKYGIKALMDISDGLYGDLTHMAKSSNLTITISEENLKIHPELESYCRFSKTNPLDYIIRGGEDYKLLFACEKEKFDEIKKEIPTAFPVGISSEFNGNFIEGCENKSSFNHGKDER